VLLLRLTGSAFHCERRAWMLALDLRLFGTGMR
jgi:hypothetical protein